MNTFINVDSAKRRRGKKPKAGFINEEDDDRHFTKTLRGGDGKRFGMGDDLKKIVEETVDESDDQDHEQEGTAKRGVPKTAKQNPSPGGPTPKTGPAGKYQPPVSNGFPPLDPEAVHEDIRVNIKVPTLGKLFSEDDHHNNTAIPPLYRTLDYRHANPYSLVHNRYPSAPPYANSEFFAIPSGQGRYIPGQFRPSSSRSFTVENGLFDDATIQTPAQNRATSEPYSSPQPAVNATQTQQKNASEANAGNQPVMNQPAANQQPAINQPAINQPAAHQPAVNQPAVNQPAVNQPVVNQPAAHQPAANQQPAAHQPAVNQQPAAHQPAVNQPVENQRAVNQQAVNPPAVNQSSANQPAMYNSPLPQGDHLPRITYDFDSTNPPIDFNADDGHEADVENEENENERSESESDFIDQTPPRVPPSTKQQIAPQIVPQAATSGRRRRRDWTLGALNGWQSALVVFLMVLGIVWTGLTILSPGSSSLKSDAFPTRNRSFSFYDIKESVYRFVPSIPKSIKPLIKLPKAKSTYGRPYDPPSDFVENLHEKIPDKVYAKVGKDGKLEISQDFWHAIRDMIKGDPIALTVEKAKDKGIHLSEAEWLAIRSRLEAEGLKLPGEPSGSGAGSKVVPNVDPKDTDALLNSKASRSWLNWLNQNEEMLKKSVGGTILNKEDFVKLFREEIRSYQLDIKKEFATLDSRIQDIGRSVAKLRSSAKGSGLSENEVRAIIDAMVNKAIHNAKLDSIASGRIRGHTDSLVNQVNFFSIGSGAILDPSYTSPVWQVPRGYFKYKSKAWYLRDGYKPQPRLSALVPWSEEGECFCAGPSVLKRVVNTNTIHVVTSRVIIPQNLVVEHILPGSTLDPGAMPKDVEVWIYIEEMSLRKKVKAFSDEHFPETPKETVLNEGFVKVGHFTYENRTWGEPFQVFKLSDELIGLGASSQNILVRAISNYGADHTCFYRLRMYGEVVDTRPWEADGVEN